MHTITAVFADGTTVTRRTEAAYIYASRRGHGMPVHFHASYDAARRAVSKYSGEVVPTDFRRAPVAREAEIWNARYTDGYERTIVVRPGVNPMIVAREVYTAAPCAGTSRVRSQEA